MAMSSKSMQMAYEKFEQTKRAFRRDGYNQGIRVAARLAEDCWVVGTAHREQAEETAKAILKLLKPRLENPNVTVKR
jgi:hypothetical protein